jgi:probable F420-dependent oxidoreductase
VKIGIAPINVGYPSHEPVAAIAKKAEEVGVESLWTYEHVLVPMDYDSKYPYHRKGKMPATPETPFLDPLIALSHVAGLTTKIKLGTGVNILPQTNPLLAAKQVASVDFLSGGRLMFGVGVGWLSEEFDAMGTPFERRGARFNDYLVAMKKVWTGDVVEHDSDFVSWHGFKSHPQPAQRPHPPIIVGGTSKPAFRRVAKHGDGWISPNNSVEQLEEQIQELHAIAKENDRDPDTIEITGSWMMTRQPDDLARYRDLGVDRLIIPLTFLPGGNPIEGLDRLGDEVLSKL